MIGPAQRSVLVLGLSKAGKSSFIGQVLHRLTGRSEGRLQGVRSVTLAPYETLLSELAAGLPPQHTPHSVFEDRPLYLEDRKSGELIKLTWPEYAGEQLREIIDQRRVPRRWASRVAESDEWILFVRPHLTPLPEDPISRRIPPQPGNSGLPGDNAEGSPYPLTAQARLIEGLQLLSFLRHSSIQRRRCVPSLAVMISAVDEIRDQGNGAIPEDLFASLMPLLYEYIRSNWADDAYTVLGVSALGRELDRDRPDESFLLEGPASQGYLVLPDGSETPDLTLAISLLLDLRRG